MKKIFYILAIIATLSLAACRKTPIGGSAVQDLSGEWYVQVDIVDENGEVVEDGEDFNDGRCLILTYNNANNDNNVLYINDLGGFWDFIVQVPCNKGGLTFGDSSIESFPNESYDSNVSLWGGKIVLGGTTTPSAQKADYIEFLCKFDDDDLADYGMPGVSYLDYYGGVAYRVSGFRYTGFELDE